MKWLVKKNYNLIEGTDSEGNPTYERGEFKNYEPVLRTDNGIPRGSDLSYEYLLVDGGRYRFPVVLETEVDGRMVLEVSEDASKLDKELKEEKYLSRINNAPRMKAKLAALLADLPGNDAVANTSALSQFQTLLENGSWGTLRSLFASSDVLPQDIKSEMLDALDAHLSKEA